MNLRGVRANPLQLGVPLCRLRRRRRRRRGAEKAPRRGVRAGRVISRRARDVHGDVGRAKRPRGVSLGSPGRVRPRHLDLSPRNQLGGPLGIPLNPEQARQGIPRSPQGILHRLRVLPVGPHHGRGLVRRRGPIEYDRTPRRLTHVFAHRVLHRPRGRGRQTPAEPVLRPLRRERVEAVRDFRHVPGPLASGAVEHDPGEVPLRLLAPPAPDPMSQPGEGLPERRAGCPGHELRHRRQQLGRHRAAQGRAGAQRLSQHVVGFPPERVRWGHRGGEVHRSPRQVGIEVSRRGSKLRHLGVLPRGGDVGVPALQRPAGVRDGRDGAVRGLRGGLPAPGDGGDERLEPRGDPISPRRLFFRRDVARPPPG